MAEPTSIWKKEIRLGRRSRLDEAVEEAMKTEPADEPQTSAEQSIGKQSLWKKEFHIGSAPGDHPSFWKKEIRLIGPRKSTDDVVASPEPAPVQQPVEQAQAPVPAAEPEPVASMLEDLVAPEPEQPVDAVERFFEPPAPPMPGQGVTLDEIDARLEAAKAVLAVVEAKPTPAPAEMPVAETKSEPAAPMLEQPPVAPGVPVTLDEIDARLEAARAVLGAAEETPTPAVTPQPQPTLEPEPVSAQPSAPGETPPLDPELQALVPHIATLEELDARIEAAKAAAMALEAKPAPTPMPEPSYKPEAVHPAAPPMPAHVEVQTPPEAQAQPSAPVRPPAGAVTDPIDARLEAAKAAFEAVLSPTSPKAVPVAAEAPPSVEPPVVEPESVVTPLPEPELEPEPESEPELEPKLEEPASEPAPAPVSQSFWKKEIGGGRKAKASPEVAPAPVLAPEVEPAPKPASQSFWKKEIGGSRKAKPKQARVSKSEPTPVQAAKPASQSFWKKEIGGGRKAKASSEVAPAPVLAPEVELAPKPASQSFWKKEIGGGGKAKVKAKAKSERAPEPQSAAKTASQPFWKKELSIGRSSKPKTEQASQERSKSPAKRELRAPRLRMPTLPSLPSRGGTHAKNGVVELVGLRIGSSQLAAALVNNNGSAELLQLARTPLEPGIVAAGEVRDPGALAQALKRFFAQNKLPRAGIRLGVATNRIGVRVLDLPAMDDPKLFGNAIRFRAQEVLPFPLSDAVLDHVLLGESKDQDGAKQQRVLLVFAHRELVDGYLDACRRAGLKLAGIDFDAFALLRALSEKAADSAPKTSALVAVSIGRERTIFAVSDGSTCDFARVLEWGGGSLDIALETALGITPLEAERLKRTLSLEGEPEAGDLSPTQVEAARAALREELQVLSRELLSSLQFYQSRPESLDIGEVLLTGGGAELGGIGAELGRQIGVPVRIGDPLGGVTVGDSVATPANTGSLTIAVGLGMEG
jgi:type IV pilus assembly protein PilM